MVAKGVIVKDIAGELNVTIFAVHRLIDRIVIAWQLDPTKDTAVQIALRMERRTVA